MEISRLYSFSNILKLLLSRKQDEKRLVPTEKSFQVLLLKLKSNGKEGDDAEEVDRASVSERKRNNFRENILTH